MQRRLKQKVLRRPPLLLVPRTAQIMWFGIKIRVYADAVPVFPADMSFSAEEMRATIVQLVQSRHEEAYAVQGFIKACTIVNQIAHPARYTRVERETPLIQLGTPYQPSAVRSAPASVYRTPHPPQRSGVVGSSQEAEEEDDRQIAWNAADPPAPDAKWYLPTAERAWTQGWPMVIDSNPIWRWIGVMAPLEDNAVYLNEYVILTSSTCSHLHAFMAIVGCAVSVAAVNSRAPKPSTSSEPPTAAEPSSSTSPPTTQENTPASTDWESESSETRPPRKMDRFCESVARAGTSVDNAIYHVNEALVDIFGPKKARKYLLKRGQIRYQMEKHGDERVAEHLTRMTQQVCIGFDGKINLIKQHNRRAVKREVITIVAYPTEKYLKHFNSNSAK
ncbi:hypothetical protein Ciccas_012680 [Cichlidogyrus casuarinus]|uniref:Uncharacterized protein n=1 Tax=Cichlidogyrus casuarinus TaxID=1844966 RepID=A0ABD2PMM7_9PLAT